MCKKTYKHWLFANTPRGAKAGAILFSIIETAQKCAAFCMTVFDGYNFYSFLGLDKKRFFYTTTCPLSRFGQGASNVYI